MVVSVGHKGSKVPRSFQQPIGELARQVSPPESALSDLLPGQEEIKRSRQVAGGACMVVILLSAIFAAKPGGIGGFLGCRQHHRAPTLNGRRSSIPAMSNDREDRASSVSSLLKPGARRIELRKLTTAR